MDLIRGLNSDDEVDLVISEDESNPVAVVPTKVKQTHRKAGISWNGLQDGFSSSEEDEERPSNAAPVSALCWLHCWRVCFPTLIY